MISKEQALTIHRMLIKEFGGSDGLRDLGTLESALLRPFQTFGAVELYPGILEKVAALMESIITNHPFVDGNKRTGYVLGKALLLTQQISITATEDVVYQFVIDIAAGQLRYEGILDWLRQNTTGQ